MNAAAKLDLSEKRYGDFCTVHSGIAFYPFDARPSEVRIEDIAHSLSLQCRFGGHCREFYSVAQHSVLVSQIVVPELALAGLLHDAAEAYLVDLPRPLKHAPGFLTYRNLERTLLEVIAERFGLERDFDRHVEIVHADAVLLATEKRDLMPPSAKPWAPLPAPHSRRISPWSPRESEISFLARFGALA